MDEWLLQNLSPGSIVGLDPKYYGKLEWDALEATLAGNNVTLSHVNYNNLVDMVWSDDRPECPTDPVRQLSVQFSGKLVRTKLQDIYSEMSSEGVEILIVSELDEIACKPMPFE